jgi:hypothetical protein
MNIVMDGNVIQCTKHEFRQIPTDNLFMLMFTPIVLSVMFHSRVKLTLVVWISVIITILICLAVFSLTTSISICIIYILFTSLMLLEMRRQNISYFFVSQRLEMLLSENERLA